ncbi:hypothetical protein [Flavobacterium sp. AJR]|uniref:hypothetical protein n=1 Tax=Flavobacterium sp. AJR TaxID=1979369 RepID=UPI000A3D792E|nr:hypothetical protein [Flavobacterium sp. AJR]OUL60839.1 hypothetical protein B8T70_18190 [Flavobacterium sp. AJR]
MDTRKIKLVDYENVGDFKIQLLRKLNLFDSNKNCESEFYERIQNYLNRNSQLIIEISISKTELSNKIYTKILRKLTAQEIPKNYPLNASNMETQAYFREISGQEFNLLKLKAENDSILEVNSFMTEFKKINNFSNLKISIKQ